MEKKSCRVLLVSDMHYTTEETHAELKLKFPESNTSVAAGDAFGHTQREKVEKVFEGIMYEDAKAPLDAVFVLGDLSIDDYDYRNLPVNYCEQFKIDCLDRLRCPSFVLAGNHDSYPDALWREVFGYGRQYSVTVADQVFIMLDTFAACPASGASGAKYTPVDVEFLKSELARCRGKNIFLCSHFFNWGAESDEFKRLVRESEDIVCLFHGHTHRNRVVELGEEYGNKQLFDIGGYGYNGMVVDGKWDFSQFDPAWAWGYQILEINEKGISTYHRKPPIHYVAGNGVFDLEETISGQRTYEPRA